MESIISQITPMAAAPRLQLLFRLGSWQPDLLSRIRFRELQHDEDKIWYLSYLLQHNQLFTDHYQSQELDIRSWMTSPRAMPQASAPAVLFQLLRAQFHQDVLRAQNLDAHYARLTLNEVPLPLIY